MVNRILRVHFRNLKTAVIGPDLSHRRNLVKGLLRAPLVRQAINEECESERISQEKAEGIALRYANEIASDFSYPVIRFLEVILSWFWNKLYEGSRSTTSSGCRTWPKATRSSTCPATAATSTTCCSYLLFRNGLTRRTSPPGST